MSKFYKDADFNSGERAAKAHAGYLDFMSQKIEERDNPKSRLYRPGAVEEEKPSKQLLDYIAGKILRELLKHGAHSDGNISLTETANVLAVTIAKQPSFSAKVSHIEMMVGTHLKKEGEFSANPDVLKSAVKSILNITNPPSNNPPPPKMSAKF